MKKFLFTVLFVTLLSTVGCGSSECEIARLKKTGTNQYCATDPSCCLCSCYQQGKKWTWVNNECACAEPQVFDCEEDNFCQLSDPDACIERYYEFTKFVCTLTD